MVKYIALGCMLLMALWFCAGGPVIGKAMAQENTGISPETIQRLLTLARDPEAATAAEFISSILNEQQPLTQEKKELLKKTNSQPEDEEEEFSIQTLISGELVIQDRYAEVDWKDPGEEVAGSLAGLLTEEEAAALPSFSESPMNRYQPPKTLHECSLVLQKKYGLEILLWDTNGDSYGFIVVKESNADEAIAAAKELDIRLAHIVLTKEDEELFNE